LIRPVIGSTDRSTDGKTYHHLSSNGARGYFLTDDSGIDTSQNPAARLLANFKALLGAESNRDLLIHFLNAILGAELPRSIRAVVSGRGPDPQSS
jgi:hypothetical protein